MTQTFIGTSKQIAKFLSQLDANAYVGSTVATTQRGRRVRLDSDHADRLSMAAEMATSNGLTVEAYVDCAGCGRTVLDSPATISEDTGECVTCQGIDSNGCDRKAVR